jgi:integrase
MNGTKAELSGLQERIADGRAPELPEGKDSEFYWHPTIAGFALRLYANGSGTWVVQYRNPRGQTRRHKIGNAAVLTLSLATIAAKRVLGDVANGLDPQQERQEELDRPLFAFGEMAERFLEARRLGGTDPLSPKTLYLYRSVLKNHLGNLPSMQVDEIKRKNVADKVEIAARTSRHVAWHTRSFISTVYKWALKKGLIDIPNPAQDSWTPEKQEPRDNPLSPEELGAVWRACEAMAAVPMSYDGNPWGAQVPVAASSILADSVVLTTVEAERQSGISQAIIYKAIEANQLKSVRRADLPKDHPANHSLKITKGKGHGRDLMIEASELKRFAASRSGRMRSPAAEFAAIIRLLILLGGRLDEMASLHWDEIIEEKVRGGALVKYLYIKGSRTLERRGTKTGDDLKLPLPPIALDILAEFSPRPGNPRVFGNGKHGRLGFDRLKRQLNALIAKNEGQPLKPWHIHDLRHSLSTNMNGLGLAPPWIIEEIVNHRSNFKQGMAGRYNHAKYDVPIDVALQRWAQVIRNVADGVEAENNVVSLFERKEVSR